MIGMLERRNLPFIPSFIMMPVSGTMTLEPKKRLIVVVRDVAMPDASAVPIWEVPWLQRLAYDLSKSSTAALTSHDSRSLQGHSQRHSKYGGQIFEHACLLRR